MELALVALLLSVFVQSVAKFVVWTVVPYETRIGRVASYYAGGPRRIAIADGVLLALSVVLVVLLFATDMRYLSFVTGLAVGMTLIQVFFHRFNRPLPRERSPESPASPIELMSYAIQAQPGLAWREAALITALSVWAVYMLVTRGLFG
ncbi:MULTISPECIES: hypothetical protein [Nocardiopsis]|uniref:DUF1772 domain-containing protein n=1 Tax=Nocardiopsis sinuspersici TaxID=501010 RepID=A0A1V3C100_9ACTN|nr:MULTISPECIES: hypothetical protein [Nocardiopsis]OOC54343.1 hypothetical protein NOSIN_11455 [Nocardiopsis sinuspersici]